MSSEANVAKAGLEGIVAAQSSISDVNGEEGKLIYAGYDIHDLAQHASFEEVIYLLWNGKLPTAAQLASLKAQLNDEAGLPVEIVELIRLIPKTSNPMDMYGRLFLPSVSTIRIARTIRSKQTRARPCASQQSFR
jgi:citrate synthase